MLTLKNMLCIVAFLCVTALEAQLKYPETRTDSTFNIQHDIRVEDRYQWLENTTSLEVLEWIENQNKLTTKYLKKNTARDQQRVKMKSLFWFRNNDKNRKRSLEENKTYFKIKSSGLNSLKNIYAVKANKKDRLFIEATSISKEDKIGFKSLYPSSNNAFLAYSYKRNGSDWKELKIVGLNRKKHFNETLKELLAPQVA